MLNLNGNRWLSHDANGSAGGAAEQTTPPAADGAAGTDAGAQQAAGQQQTPPAEQQQQSTQQPADSVTMTQEAFSAKMAAEKNQGRNAVLNELGVKDIEAVKKALALAAAVEGSTKTPEQKATDESTKASEAEQRAAIAEQKLVLYKAKVKDEYEGDVLALVKARMEADKTLTFDTALEAIKKAHAAMFGEASGDDDGSGQQQSGTGVPPGPKKNKGDATGSYGAMAAAAVKPPQGAAGPDTFFSFNK